MYGIMRSLTDKEKRLQAKYLKKNKVTVIPSQTDKVAPFTGKNEKTHYNYPIGDGLMESISDCDQSIRNYGTGKTYSAGGD